MDYDRTGITCCWMLRVMVINGAAGASDGPVARGEGSG